MMAVDMLDVNCALHRAGRFAFLLGGRAMRRTRKKTWTIHRYLETPESPAVFSVGFARLKAASKRCRWKARLLFASRTSVS